MNHNKLRGIIFANDVFYPIVDGVVRIVDELHSHYLAQHIPSHVICSRHPQFVDTAPHIIRIPSLPVPGKYRLALPYLLSKKLSLIDPDTISVIHAHSPFLMTYALLRWAKNHHKPVVLTFHSKYLEKFKNSPWPLRTLAPLAYRYVIHIANLCDIITTPTHAHRELLISHGIRSDKFYIVPNGIPPIPRVNPESLKFKSEPILQKILEKKAQGNHILLYVGQLIKEKNPDLLITSLAELQKNNFPFFCVLVGMGDQYHPLQELTQQLKLQAHVFLTNRVVDYEVIHQIYSQVDLLTFPSTYEVRSLVVLEAAQHGVPTMGIQNATGVADIVIHQKTGYLSAQTPQAFADGIIDALSNPWLYKKVSQAAQKFLPVSHQDMISEFELIYDKALGGC